MSVSEILLNKVAATGPGSTKSIAPELYRRGYIVSVSGAGAVSATVVVEVLDKLGVWAQRMTFTLSGTNLATDVDVDDLQPFIGVRGNVTALSGTGAVVTLSVSATA
jgi:hypothetical protein